MTTVAPTVTAQYSIGADVECTGGECGELKRVVIDPVARRLTHLVVEPKHEQTTGRLVPIAMVISTSEQGIHLGCTTEEFDELEQAEEVEFLPGEAGTWGYGPGQVLSLPYYGVSGVGMGGLGMGGVGLDSGPHAVTSDRVPVGEVEVRRGQHVQASDGAIGHVKGLVVDAADQSVTHVLLDEGHLWGQKMVAIPIGAVANVADGVILTLTKKEVGDLPSVDLDQS
jgi:sporulation protein YlmC with PRC-barrel domain